jgi:hypothetical protein
LFCTIERLQRRHDLAGREHADLELVVGQRRHFLGDRFGATPKGIERFGKTRRQTPLELRHRLRNGRRRERARGAADAGGR